MRSIVIAALISFALTVPAAAAKSVVARVDLSEQKMRVIVDGEVAHEWAVSTGRGRYRTPTGSFQPYRMHKRYFSKKYHGAPMPYSVFYHRGYAIHGTTEVKKLGRPASHGCVRLHPDNARKLFTLIKRVGPKATRIRIVN